MEEPEFFFPEEFPYDFMESPVGSLDSDEEEKESPTKIDLGGSPQSTLCSARAWEGEEQRRLQERRRRGRPMDLPLEPVMRPLFLSSPAPPSRESTGTGVFLPRSSLPPTVTTRSKSGACSTVLLPARVVQALKLNLSEIGARPTFAGGFILDKDAMRARTRQLQSQQRTKQARVPPNWTC